MRCEVVRSSEALVEAGDESGAAAMSAEAAAAMAPRRPTSGRGVAPRSAALATSRSSIRRRLVPLIVAARRGSAAIFNGVWTDRGRFASKCRPADF
eukprot:scaffold7159_cov119-Isochrysis_galbana.AAC.2